MSELTKEECAWIKKMQKLLDNPPSDRLGFYTTGDASVTVYDNTNEFSFSLDMDFPDAIRDAGAGFDVFLKFPSNVVSTVA